MNCSKHSNGLERQPSSCGFGNIDDDAQFSAEMFSFGNEPLKTIWCQNFTQLNFAIGDRQNVSNSGRASLNANIRHEAFRP